MICVGNKDVPEFAALFLMAMTLGLNYMSIICILYLVGYKIDWGLDTKLKLGVFSFLLVSLLYFLFVHNNKYLEIAKNYKNETPKKEKMGKIFAIIYVVLSIGLTILCFYLMMKKNRGEL
jgi:hypothetical protein